MDGTTIELTMFSVMVLKSVYKYACALTSIGWTGDVTLGWGAFNKIKMTDGNSEFPVGPAVSTRQARIAWKREKLIAQEEVAVLRQKLRECTQREHINKIQRCREEAIEYLEALNKYKKGLKELHT